MTDETNTGDTSQLAHGHTDTSETRPRHTRAVAVASGVLLVIMTATIVAAWIASGLSSSAVPTGSDSGAPIAPMTIAADAEVAAGFDSGCTPPGSTDLASAEPSPHQNIALALDAQTSGQ